MPSSAMWLFSSRGSRACLGPARSAPLCFCAHSGLGFRRRNDNALYDAFNQEEALQKAADPEKLRQWQIQTAREAITAYRKVLQASLDQAKEIQPDDLKALMKLTGVGFGPVIKRLVPRMMTLR